jgi:hypothetical protein
MSSEDWKLWKQKHQPYRQISGESSDEEDDMVKSEGTEKSEGARSKLARRQQRIISYLILTCVLLSTLCGLLLVNVIKTDPYGQRIEVTGLVPPSQCQQAIPNNSFFLT